MLCDRHCVLSITKVLILYYATGVAFRYASTQFWLDRLNMNTPYQRSEAALEIFKSSPLSGIRNPFVVCVVICLVVAVYTFAGKTYGHLLVLFLGSFGLILAHLETTSPSNAAEENTDQAVGENTDVDVELFTPNDVDDLLIDANIVECDCSFIAQTDMSTQVQATESRDERDVGECPVASTADKHTNNLPHHTEQAAQASANVVNRVRTWSLTRQRADSLRGADHDTVPPSKHVSVANLKEFQLATCYFREFLAKGHPDLGRKGPTCPFVPLALRKNSLYMGTVRTGGTPTPPRYIRSVVRQFLTRFSTLEPTDDKTSVYKAVLLIFPDVPQHAAAECIDSVQQELKIEFVERGLMLGEFHLQNNASGLHNPSFFPLRTPTPSLAVRKIVPSDLAFLDVEKYTATTRVRFLTSYLKQFDGRTLGSRDKEAVSSASIALNRAKRELR